MTKQQFEALTNWVEAKIRSMNDPNDLIDSIHEREYFNELEALLVTEGVSGEKNHTNCTNK